MWRWDVINEDNQTEIASTTHLSNPVQVMTGFFSFRALQMSDLTLRVAVAVNARTGTCQKDHTH